MVKKNITNSNLWLKLLLWFGVAYHVIPSIGAMINSKLIPFLANNLYGFNLELTDQVKWIINPFAAYMLAFGVFIGVAATDPVKYKKILYVVPAFILLRVIQRVYFLTANTGFSVGNPMNNIIDITLSALFGITVFVLLRKIKD